MANSVGADQTTRSGASDLNLHCLLRPLPAGTQRENDVVSTSMRRDHVASTLIRRHFDVVFLLGASSLPILRV